MTAVRLWSVRNAGWLKKCHAALESTLALCNPLLKAIGHERLDKPFAAVEGAVKGFLFDSQSCGQCTLGETGMACPMNCPKTLRNGPCGGVRQNVAGVHIPNDVIKRLAGAEDQKQEGVNLCVDLIQQVREIEGVSGVHIMAYRMEDRIGEIVTRSNALGGREPWRPAA